MKWVPAWLGEAYCTLSSRLGGTFAVGEVAKALNVPTAKAGLIVSRLAQAGWLKRLEKGRYGVVEPSEVFERITIFREIERNLARVPQREFIPKLKRYMELVVWEFGTRLVSSAVFGSLARGNATSTSDIDVLLVIERLPPALSDRYDEFAKIGRLFRAKRRRGEPISPISPVLYTPDEASSFHSIYLDMTRHAIVLLDRKNLLQGKLAELSRRLEELGSRRLEVHGKPVWILKPDLRRGEVVELG